jgi:hypothetical protein
MSGFGTLQRIGKVCVAGSMLGAMKAIWPEKY